MEIEATQALDLDSESGEEDPVCSQRRKVGNLRVKCYKNIAEKVYPVFEGQNIVGRHDKAEIFIPAKPLSKKHACIEVTSGQHFVFDYGSKNKTRRGKMVLRPNVRYELTNKTRLIFADVETEYFFEEESTDSDSTDSMSQPLHESVLLIAEDSQHEDISRRSDAVAEQLSIKIEKSDEGEASRKCMENRMKEKDGSDNIQKRTNDGSDGDVLAADSDKDNEEESIISETPHDLNPVTVVGQTPGNLLKRLCEASLNNTGNSASSSVNNSLQDLSGNSFRLDSTQEASKASFKASSTGNKVDCDNLTAAADDQDLAQSHATESNTSGLLIHESDDADSDESEISDCHRSVAKSGRPDLRTEGSKIDYDSSYKRLNSSALASNKLKGEDPQPGSSGLAITESDNEETDVSDNECNKLEIGQSGFFSPDMLQKMYSAKPDLLSETDKSDAEGLFSPGVAGRTKSDATCIGDKIDGKESDSQDYMLVATQAYGIEDSESSDTDFEGSLGFEYTGSKGELKVEKPTDGAAQSRDLSSIDYSVQECDTLQLSEAYPSGFNEPPTLSGQEGATLPVDSSGIRESSEKSLSIDGEQGAETLQLTGDLQNEDDLERNKRKDELRRNSLLRDDRLDTRSNRVAYEMERDVQECATIPLHDIEQEAKTIPLQVSDFDKYTDESIHKRGAPLRKIEQKDKIVKLEDRDVGVNGKGGEGIDFIDMNEQEGMTIVVEEHSVEGDKRREEEAGPINRIEQEAKTIALEDFSVEVDKKKDEKARPINRIEQECMTIALESYSVDVDADRKLEEGTVSQGILQQECKTIDVHETNNNSKESSKESSYPLEKNCKQPDFEPSFRKRGDSGVEMDEKVVKAGQTAALSKYDKQSNLEKIVDSVAASTARKACEELRGSEKGSPTGTTTLPGASFLQLPSWTKERNIGAETYKITSPKDLLEEATQAYVMEDSSCKTDSEEVVKETQSDTEVEASQLQGLYDQPTLPYDYQMETDSEHRESNQAYDAENCATQAYVVHDSDTLMQSNEEAADDRDDPNSVNEDPATQAYGLIKGTSDPSYPDDETDDMGATQAYGVLSKYESAENMIMKSDDDSEDEECETQVYGVIDSQVLGNKESDNDVATQAYGVQQTTESNSVPRVSENESKATSEETDQAVFHKPSSLPVQKPNSVKQNSKHKYSTRKAGAKKEQEISINKEEANTSRATKNKGRARSLRNARVAKEDFEEGNNNQHSETLPISEEDTRQKSEIGRRKVQSRKNSGRRQHKRVDFSDDAAVSVDTGEIKQIETKLEQFCNGNSSVLQNKEKVDEDNRKSSENTTKLETGQRKGKRRKTADKSNITKTWSFRNRSDAKDDDDERSSETRGKVHDEMEARTSDSEVESQQNATTVSSSLHRGGKRKIGRFNKLVSVRDSPSGSRRTVKAVDEGKDDSSDKQLESGSGRSMETRKSVSTDEGQPKTDRGRPSQGNKLTSTRGGRASKDNSAADARAKEEGSETVKVMFTGLTNKNLEKSFMDLGAEIADSVYDATHLVTDKVRRTVKFLCCLSRGVHIVDPSWLDECQKAKCLTGADAYTIQDKSTEKQYSFNLRRSIEKARDAKMLDGYSVYVTKSVKPDQTQMKDIIQCCGGKALKRLPKTADSCTLVVSCDEDKSEIKSAAELGLEVHTAEILLTGILRQELDLTQYRLQFDHGQPKSRGKRSYSKSEPESTKRSSISKRQKR